MNFKHLVSIIEQTSQSLRKQALTSVNQALVIRNWLIGYYLVEYEQKGEDRAKYGEKLLETIAKELKKKNIIGMSFTNLKLFRQFYETYRQIGQPMADQLNFTIQQTLPDELRLPISQPPADQFKTAPELLLSHFSFRHFTELIKIDDPLKRGFYEKEAIKGNWSSRQLKRQIESLLLERTCLSTEKEQLLKSV